MLGNAADQAFGGFFMERIIRPREISKATGLSRTSIWRLEAKGEFPQRRQVGPGAVGWLASEVEDWLRSRPVVSSTQEVGQKRNVGGE